MSKILRRTRLGRERLFATLEPQAKKRLLRAIVAEVRVTEDREALPGVRFLDPWAMLLELDTGEA